MLNINIKNKQGSVAEEKSLDSDPDPTFHLYSNPAPDPDLNTNFTKFEWDTWTPVTPGDFHMLDLLAL